MEGEAELRCRCNRPLSLSAPQGALALGWPFTVVPSNTRVQAFAPQPHPVVECGRDSSLAEGITGERLSCVSS